MNQPTTESGRMAVKLLEQILPKILKDRGVWPLPIVVVTADQGALCKGLELRDRQAYDVFIRTCKRSEVHAVLLGIDRFGDGAVQHTSLPSLLTCTLYEKPVTNLLLPSSTMLRLEQFKYAIVEYEAPTRKIKATNWHNAYWKEQLADEIWQAMMPKPVMPTGVM
jgi:hypothetical protein